MYKITHDLLEDIITCLENADKPWPVNPCQEMALHLKDYYIEPKTDYYEVPDMPRPDMKKFKEIWEKSSSSEVES